MLPLPDDVAATLDALLDRALAEDIGSGDVTTLATIPAERRAGARFLVKEDGVLAGLAVAERVFAKVDPASDRGLDDGRWRCCDGGHDVRQRGGRGALHPDGRAAGVEPDAADERHRHGGPPHGRGGAARHRPRHAQDRARPARCSTSGPSARRRGQPPRRALRHGAHQGQPHRGGGRRARGHPGHRRVPAEPAAAICPSRSRRGRWPRSKPSCARRRGSAGPRPARQHGRPHRRAAST